MRKLLILLSLLLTAPAFAEDPKQTQNPNNLDLTFGVYWSGFEVGEARLISQETADAYTISANLDTVGLIRRFTKYWSTNISKGSFVDGEMRPDSYQTKWNRRKEKQLIEVEYDKNWDVTKVFADPPENRGKYPELEQENMQQTYDPVSAVILARRKIMNLTSFGSKEKHSFKIPVFDARRRFDVVINIEGMKTVEFEGEPRDFMHIQFFREPIAGFREKELKRMEDQEPVIDVYLNEDFIPVWGLGTARLGIATIKLKKPLK